MKKLAFLLLVVITSSLTSCKNKEKEETQTSTENSSETMPPQDDEKVTEQKSSTDFDINAISVSDAELGDFPFFSLPTGLKEQNKPVKRSFDKLFFPINGVMTPIEGRVYKTNLVVEKKAKKIGHYLIWKKAMMMQLKMLAVSKFSMVKLQTKNIKVTTIKPLI